MKKKLLLGLLLILSVLCFVMAFAACGEYGDTQGGEQSNEQNNDTNIDNSGGDVSHIHTNAEAVKENEIAATCTKNGSYDSVVYCLICGDEISRESVTIQATGHTNLESVKENEVAASCIADGSYDSVIYCAVCNAEVSREKVNTEKLEHSIIEVDGKSATCNESGWETYEYCEVCDYSTYKEISALGHDYEDEITLQPTYTTKGIKTYTCSRCGDTYTEDLDILGHTHEYTSKVTTAPTCTSTGICTYTCKLCGSKYFEIIKATGHENAAAVKENVVAATCTQNGSYESVIYCANCGEEQSRTTVIIKAGHTPGAAVKENEVTATCTNEGSYEKVICCTVCGEELIRELVTTAKSAHSLIHVDEKVATCTETGWIAYEYCEVCGYNTYEELTILPHTVNSHEVTIDNNKHLYIDGSSNVATLSDFWAIGGNQLSNINYDCQSSNYGYIICDSCGEYLLVSVTGEHIFSEYKYDSTAHWKECAVCGVETERVNHIMVNNVCSVCGYSEKTAKVSSGNCITYAENITNNGNTKLTVSYGMSLTVFGEKLVNTRALFVSCLFEYSEVVANKVMLQWIYSLLF